MPTSQAASIVVRERDFILYPESRTRAGYWVGAEPVQVLPRGASSSVLGKTIRDALASSKEGIKDVNDWRGLLKPLLRAAGVRSWNALQRSARLCSVQATDKIIRVIPSSNGGTVGPAKGFHSLTEKAIALAPGCSDEEIGDALTQAMELCS